MIFVISKKHRTFVLNNKIKSSHIEFRLPWSEFFLLYTLKNKTKKEKNYGSNLHDR
jgi:hypothetical protein